MLLQFAYRHTRPLRTPPADARSTLELSSIMPFASSSSDDMVTLSAPSNDMRDARISCECMNDALGSDCEYMGVECGDAAANDDGWNENDDAECVDGDGCDDKLLEENDSDDERRESGGGRGPAMPIFS